METLHTRLRRRFQFHIGPDELPLLEAAIRQHGSVQDAVMAALRTHAAEQLRLLAPTPAEPPQQPGQPAQTVKKSARPRSTPAPIRNQAARQPGPAARLVELYSSDAARVLSTTTKAVREKIRRGALPGRRNNTGYWIVELDRNRVLESGISLDPSGAALLVGLRPGTIRRKCTSGAYPGATNDGTGWQIPITDLLY